MPTLRLRPRAALSELQGARVPLPGGRDAPALDRAGAELPRRAESEEAVSEYSIALEMQLEYLRMHHKLRGAEPLRGSGTTDMSVVWAIVDKSLRTADPWFVKADLFEVIIDAEPRWVRVHVKGPDDKPVRTGHKLFAVVR